MKQRTDPGFTLIELLVVIAILGVLSSIILSSLNAARNKGNDAAVKQQISDMRPAAELIYSTTGNYNTVCDAASNPGALFRSAVAVGNDSTGVAYCIPDITAYYVSSPNSPFTDVTYTQKGTALPGKWAAAVHLYSGGYFCSDYLGNATTTSVLTISPTDADCN